jgi:hypothetical protein
MIAAFFFSLIVLLYTIHQRLQAGPAGKIPFPAPAKVWENSFQDDHNSWNMVVTMLMILSVNIMIPDREQATVHLWDTISCSLSPLLFSHHGISI